MKILFLSGWLPFPPNNGAKLRIINLLRGLARLHEVTLLTFAGEPNVNLDAPEFRALCQVQVIPARPFNPQTPRAHLGYFSPTPRSLVDSHSYEMEQKIRRVLEKDKYDLVIASQLGTAGYYPFFQDVPSLFEELEIGVFYDQSKHATSLRHRLRAALTWAKYRRYLAHLLPHFRACTVVSRREQDLVHQCVPAFEEIEVIPNCINLADYSNIDETPQPGKIVFTGSFQYRANYEAMSWFLSEVYPRILTQEPRVCLRITGDHANLPLPKAENVILTGHIPDVRPAIASAWASIVPIWKGGGTRLKILEAMALGTPVVSTTKGAEGLDVQHDEHLLIGDTPKAFADQVVRLLQERGLRERLTDNAYRLVRDKYDWSITMPQFLNLVEWVANN